MRHHKQVNTVHAETRRNWKMLDCDAFRHDLLTSDIITKLNDDCDSFCEVYDCGLHELVDNHTPIETKVEHRLMSPLAPWYNYECSLVKAMTRRLEKTTVQYTLPQRIGSGITSLLYSGLFQRAHFDYWKAVVDKCPDSCSLW